MNQFSRRDMLRTGLSGAAIAATSGLASGGETSAATSRDLPGDLKTSIAGYSYRELMDKPGQPGKMSLFDLVDICARLGVDAIEPTSYYFLKTDDEYVYALKRKAFLTGIEISGSPTRDNFCYPPGPELDAEIKKVKEWVDLCAKLGAPAIRIFAGGAVKGVSREDAFKHATGAMRQACDYAGAHGIFLTIENHGYLTETADDILRMLETVNHEWLGFNLDTGNFKGDDAYEQIERVATKATTCQFKSLVNKQPADYKRLVQIMRKAGYRGYVALEFEEKDPVTRVPVEIKKIQEAIRATA